MIISDLSYLQDVSEEAGLGVSGGYYWLGYDDAFAIESGDTLSGIAAAYYGNGGSDCYNAIADYNGISDPNKIKSGGTLILPSWLC